MALPSVTINRLSGGIGRQEAGVDYYSGYLHYFPTGYTLPSGFTTNAINICNSITDLEALGVNGLSADETKATAIQTVAVIGSTGDMATIKYTDPITLLPTIVAVYTKSVTDTTALLVATSIVANINASTYLTGFTATVGAAGAFTILPKLGLGASINALSTLSIAYSTAATLSITLAQFTGGLGSQFDVLYYHVKEAFRVQGILNGKPQGQIWVGCYNVSATTYANFSEVSTMQSFAIGQIKQIGVYANTATFATTHVTALQVQATSLQGLNTPLSIIYQGDFSTVTNLTTLSNLAILASKNVSVCIGQDGGNVGAKLYRALGKSIGMVGTTLGGVALAKVSDSLTWRDKFNVQDTLEYVTLAFANGALQSASGSGLNGLLTQIDLYRYIFLMPEIGLNGSFFNADHTASLLSSSYAYIADNRTIDKEARGLRSSIIGSLGSPLTYNPDGTLSADTVDYFAGLCDSFLATMIANNEISASKTIINPAQNVQATGTLVISVQNIQTGVARNIVINIGYVAAIS